MLGWSLSDVATATGVPLNTVRSRVRLAKNALRAAVEADPSLLEELDRRRA
jgi:RNA polymerase sigma-70 factor (ECF subfamily)